MSMPGLLSPGMFHATHGGYDFGLQTDDGPVHFLAVKAARDDDFRLLEIRVTRVRMSLVSTLDAELGEHMRFKL